MRALLLVTSALTALAVPSVALAQDAAAEAASSEGLEEIVVTAQRREESLQKAALAVTAVTGDDLTKSGITETANLGRLVPSLVVQPMRASFWDRLRSTFSTPACAPRWLAPLRAWTSFPTSSEAKGASWHQRP